ncbi:hypothetical protein ACQEVC_43615 [Plantactinospora sp. CA-294935]|uniref:hypothetical protein n=1 Tax=Plantactinospora sp. CA-294935 TaxID=3240012 RepID=UPI003D944C0A
MLDATSPQRVLGQQLRNPLAVGLRNVMMRLTPPRVALRSVARYADWRPPSETRA